ncbi:zinc finger MYM-type protein 1-like [Mercenaria mercenaria]|uniref:zinc finger MYM-type protein 1-like n=1 Tax=Mercenaria mercenaria TaxID=6596 RepID=UPI00234EB813|nr:zinc finger MYM-type protein 1-like [Mercenaria mercenaria]
MDVDAVSPPYKDAFDGTTDKFTSTDNFLAIERGKKKDIECSLSSSFSSLVDRNRQILVGIVEAIIFCGKQNIALRGQEDEARGNFRALLSQQAKHDPIMKDHLENGNPRSMYLSPQIQNEIIEICGSVVAGEIVKGCNSSFCFGFIADEATDASPMEQMALCLRFYDSSKGCLREEFVSFAECETTTGESLANSFIENRTALGVHIPKTRGQRYDGASNMSGKHRGVQARIQQLVPRAVYTHCKAHSLNLAIIHASGTMHARNMMTTVQTISFAFNYSAKRLLRFQENLENDPTSRAEIDRRTKLKSLCETRCAARSDALHTFLSSFRTVVAALVELAADYGDVKAAGYNSSIRTFGFIVALVAVEHILKALFQLSKMLQDKECDLIEAVSEAQVITGMLQAERADDDAWAALYDKSVDLAKDVDVDPSMPRHVGRYIHMPNAPADTPSQYWKTNMYLPFMDSLLQELDSRLLQGHARYKVQFLIPTKVNQLTDELVSEIFTEFEQDLQVDEATFVRECQRWSTKWRISSPQNLSTLETALSSAKDVSCTNIRRCLLILLCMPVSTATAERSFFTMRRVKTYLRNTMGTECMSGLGLLNIHRERDINAEEVVDIFARKKERRLALLFRVKTH